MSRVKAQGGSKLQHSEGASGAIRPNTRNGC